MEISFSGDSNAQKLMGDSSSVTRARLAELLYSDIITITFKIIIPI